ncbi:TetR/AcrR family transcriptional regulator [Rhodococcus erythropolis]|uniref:TetR/AcrR family transcriptional regulator n=1 Tax=Rhodococcus erythropolis TaxID=1833 RepID=UPI0024B85E38|nr:helix-turn-helix domain-containing protein [Rhodococcus erythropolis]MDJ0011416.1 helix-turn-helix domain-containing protein [Rhodococcus erythropolis]
MTGVNERRAADWLAGGNRRELATERIFAAAAELIREQGFDRFNADDVASRAGCSRATLYRYVGGKSAIREGLLSRGAASVASQVAAAVESLRGDERIVESILVAVDAIRADAAMSHGLAAARANGIDEYLVSSPLLPRTALELAGLDPEGQQSQWVVRIVLMLLAWPLADRADERRMVESFVCS